VGGVIPARDTVSAFLRPAFVKGERMSRKGKKSDGVAGRPQLKSLVEFSGGPWSGVPDTLLADGRNNLFLRDGEGALTPVSIKGALAWFVRCEPFSGGSSADWDRFLTLAADAIPD
jgi:hypothetical protein